MSEVETSWDERIEHELERINDAYDWQWDLFKSSGNPLQLGNCMTLLKMRERVWRQR